MDELEREDKIISNMISGVLIGFSDCFAICIIYLLIAYLLQL